MAQQVLPEDYVLARKHHLGVPTRKFYFDTPRSSIAITFFLILQCLIVFLLGCSVLAYGIYVDVVTTIEHHVVWPWLWISGVLILPALFGLVMYFRDNKRLMALNIVSCTIGLLIVTLWKGVFFTLGSQISPLSSLLSGLFLQIVGLLILGAAFSFVPLPRWILICADGCIFMTKFQRSKVMRWDQITSVQMGKGFANIVCNNGASLKLRATWANSSTVQHLVYAKTFRYLLARAKATYQAGERVQFGRFTVDQNGVYNGKQLFPWAALRSCEYIDAGLALISKDDTCLDLTYLSQLPNATVFVELVNLVLEGYSKSEPFPF